MNTKIKFEIICGNLLTEKLFRSIEVGFALHLDAVDFLI